MTLAKGPRQKYNSCCTFGKMLHVLFFCAYYYSYDNRGPPRLSRTISILAKSLVPVQHSIIRETREI